MYISYYNDRENINITKRSTGGPAKGNSMGLKAGAIGGVVLFSVFLFGTGKINEINLPGILVTVLLFATVIVTLYSGRLKEKSKSE